MYFITYTHIYIEMSIGYISMLRYTYNVNNNVNVRGVTGSCLSCYCKQISHSKIIIFTSYIYFVNEFSSFSFFLL